MIEPRSVYIAFDVFPRPKGSTSHIASMVEAMAREHGPVLLLCLGVADMPGFQDEGGIVIRRFKEHHPNLLKRAAGFGDFVASEVSRWSSVELLVFRDPWGGAPALLNGPDCPAVFEVNALPSWELGYTYPGFRFNHALRAKVEDAEQFCLHESDVILTVSEVTADAIAGLGVSREKIFTAPNSAAPVFFGDDGVENPIPQIGTGQWMGYVGSLHAWQGINTAVDAFAEIAPAHPGAGFIVVTGAGKAELKALRKRLIKRGVADRTMIHPPLDAASLAALLSRLRFTVAPLSETARNVRQGCCPVKIIESMAAGTPVLASDLRVTRELIEDGRDGLLVPAGNVRGFALAMDQLFSDRGRLGENARDTARRKFSRERVHAILDRGFSLARRHHDVRGPAEAKEGGANGQT